jgi:hypothetical protein
MHRSKIHKESGDDVVYYTAYLTNTTDEVIPVDYNTTEVNPVIEDTSTYYCSVVNVNLPRTGAYIFGFSDVVKYYVSIVVGGVPFTTEVLYESRGDPFQNVSLDQEQGIWTVKQFLDMINTAIGTSFTNSSATGNVPYVVEEADGSFTVIQSQVTDGTLYFNYALGNKFLGLDMTFNSYTDFLGYEVLNKDYGNNAFNTGTPEATFHNSQTGNLQQLWDDINYIFVTSDTLPCVKEFIGTDDYSSGALSSIIADFTNIKSTGYDRTDWNYSAGAGFRLIDMYSSGSLRKIGFSAKGQIADGRVFRLRILPGYTCSVKFMFIKKSLVKNLSANELSRLIK